MSETLHAWLLASLAWLAVPTHGMVSVFVSAFISGTLLAIPAEMVLLGAVYAAPSQTVLLLLVATFGNTLGGILTWWMGRGARVALGAKEPSRWELRAKAWIERFGARACFFTWVPLVGDPICALAGWLRLPFWPCLFYMAIGKALRYGLVVLVAFKFF